MLVTVEDAEGNTLTILVLVPNGELNVKTVVYDCPKYSGGSEIVYEGTTLDVLVVKVKGPTAVLTGTGAVDESLGAYVFTWR